MFKEHDFIVWGTYCKCGHECSILQNERHPWDESSFTIKLKCSVCGTEVIIDTKSAALFYDKKIHSYFNNVSGNVIDLGCGGGFLSRHILAQPNIEKVYGMDVDIDCENEISDLIKHRSTFKFINSDIKSLDILFAPSSIDFLVSRDVFMFIEDTDTYFNTLSKLVTKGIKQMGWYIEGNKRMKNKLTPAMIAKEYEKYGFTAELEYLDWYKSGYFINAYKK